MLIDRCSLFSFLGLLFFCAQGCAAFGQTLAPEECIESHVGDRLDTRNRGRDQGARRENPSPEPLLEASLSWVADGDSIWVYVQGRELEVRLADIDAPERDQPFGWEAKLGLIDLLRDRRVRLMRRDVDRHGRIVARVWSDDLDVSRELVRRGLAWFYPAYGRDFSLRCEERLAKADQRGLWVQPSPQAPWTHRLEMDAPERDRGR